MYLHLLFLILAGVSVNYTQSGKCNSEKRIWPWVRLQQYRAIDDAVTKIAIETIKAETSFRNFCNSHAGHILRETYGMEQYKLLLSIDDFDEDTISVKVMHRLVYVRAEDCRFTYADVRILPEIVDTTKGKWNYRLGELTILFPYITTRELEVEKSCGGAVNTDVIVVPKSKERLDEEPKIDVRSGFADLDKKLMEYSVKKV